MSELKRTSKSRRLEAERRNKGLLKPFARPDKMAAFISTIAKLYDIPANTIQNDNHFTHASGHKKRERDKEEQNMPLPGSPCSIKLLKDVWKILSTGKRKTKAIISCPKTNQSMCHANNYWKNGLTPGSDGKMLLGVRKDSKTMQEVQRAATVMSKAVSLQPRQRILFNVRSNHGLIDRNKNSTPEFEANFNTKGKRNSASKLNLLNKQYQTQANDSDESFVGKRKFSMKQSANCPVKTAPSQARRVKIRYNEILKVVSPDRSGLAPDESDGNYRAFSKSSSRFNRKVTLNLLGRKAKPQINPHHKMFENKRWYDIRPRQMINKYFLNNYSLRSKKAKSQDRQLKFLQPITVSQMWAEANSRSERNKRNPQKQIHWAAFQSVEDYKSVPNQHRGLGERCASLKPAFRAHGHEAYILKTPFNLSDMP